MKDTILLLSFMELQVRGLVKQHLDSFNYFVSTEIKKIVFANEWIRSKVDERVYLRWNCFDLYSIIFPIVTSWYFLAIENVFIFYSFTWILHLNVSSDYGRYSDVRIGEPSMIIDGVTEKLTPHKCRLSDTT